MYNISVSSLVDKLDSSFQGLSSNHANKLLIEYGPNELEEKNKISAWRMFLRQFKDFMILILIAAAVLSGTMGDMTDAIIILVIVFLNASVGFVQEYQAEKAMEALKSMTVTQTQVLRDNNQVIISSTQLVPGDMVVMEAGNIIPADIRLIEAHSLRVDESSLTGESVPIDKNINDLSGINVPIGDQFNMVFKGTLVTNGRAKGLVVATGMKTVLGKIANMLQEKEVMTPLQARMDKFGKKLSYIILLICAVLFVSGVLRGEDIYTLLLLSISLAVAAIPEALPALITIALSRGAARLTKKHALVRKLSAVETLGSVTYICSDKTGTLTQNKMKVVEIHEVSPQLHLSMSLNHDIKFDLNREPIGEPTELALVKYILDKHGYEEYLQFEGNHSRIAELPFDSDRKCMTTAHRYQEKFLIITKGASETIGAILLDNNKSRTLQEISNQWASEGKRVIAYAFKIVDQLPEPFEFALVENDLSLAGIVGMIDPPRDEVKVAIDECKTAGIKVVMITGDHPVTAKAIAKELDILEDKDLVLTGPELDLLEDEAFRDQVSKVAVYARVSPAQKLRIVRMLQSEGHFAAMTGDGVNDAPSLKAANIGVAMGINGTEVSKEAADMVLLDDNFATIVTAIKEGRRIFDNIRKFVKYIMTCNSAEIWTIFLAPLLGMPIPLLPIHILWVNLVTDGVPALALANEKAEIDIMSRPPRPTNESLFSDGVGYHILWVGILMAGITLGMQAWSLHNNVDHWQTMVFTVLSLSQLGHVLGVRSDRTFLYKQGFFSNKMLLFSVLFTFMLQLGVIYVPFMNEIFKTQPLTLIELGICTGGAVILFHAIELEKWIKKRIKYS